MIIRPGVNISRYLQLTTSEKISKLQRKKETIVITVIKTFLFSTTQKPLVRKGFLGIEASRSRSVIHTTTGTVPLDERSARYRDLYLITNKTYKRQTSISLVGFA